MNITEEAIAQKKAPALAIKPSVTKLVKEFIQLMSSKSANPPGEQRSIYLKAFDLAYNMVYDKVHDASMATEIALEILKDIG